MQEKCAELMDREAIRDCIYRYCRGVDRRDEAALMTCYWPDATDQHGEYQGDAAGFIARVINAPRNNLRSIHQVSNILIEFRDNCHAIVESYFNALQRKQGEQVHLAGRYCDIFEKRGDEWRVLERIVVYDWIAQEKPLQDDEQSRFGIRRPVGGFWPDDPIYHLDVKGNLNKNR